MKKELYKKVGFVTFVMAVFLAGFSLTVLREYPWMVCIAGLLLLIASVFLVMNWEKEGTSAAEKTTEMLLVDRIADLMRGNEKAEKGVYIAVKKQHEAMESGMEALRGQIAELIKSQEKAVKTVVMYNKENAKQMAMSEREELRRLCEVLKESQTGGQETDSLASATEAVREMSRRLYEELHENGEAMLSELGTTVDSLEEMKEMLKQLCENRSMAYAMSAAPVSIAEEMPEPEAFFGEEEISVSEDLFEAEESSEPSELSEPDLAEDLAAFYGMTEEGPEEESEEVKMLSEPIEIPEPELSEDLISFYELTENNPEITPEMLSEPTELPEPELPETPEEEMQEVELPQEEAPEAEVPEEETPEDATASSGVDVIDLNKPLSAEEIAAMFATLGN